MFVTAQCLVYGVAYYDELLNAIKLVDVFWNPLPPTPDRIYFDCSLPQTIIGGQAVAGKGDPRDSTQKYD